MRTTLSLEPDVFAAARKLAEARSESIGKVVSDLMRRGLKQPRQSNPNPVFLYSRSPAPRRH